jgi:Sec-independent protein secretion pathway component TatC
MMLAVPMIVLYELGILAARVLARRAGTGESDSASAA